jgi:hypothetical protein
MKIKKAYKTEPNIHMCVGRTTGRAFGQSSPRPTSTCVWGERRRSCAAGPPYSQHPHVCGANSMGSGLLSNSPHRLGQDKPESLTNVNIWLR